MDHKITEALTTAIQFSAWPMVLTDPAQPDNPMVAVNPAFMALTGYTTEQIVGRNCRFLQGPETDPATRARIRACLDEGSGCIEWIVNYRRDGTRFWNLLFLSPVFSRDGRLLHFLGNQRDITEGPPAAVPDFTLGKAGMPPEGRQIFDAVLLDLLDETAPGDPSARALEKLVEAARRLNTVTVRLAPAAWSPPPR